MIDRAVAERLPQALACSRSRIGGAHLNAVAPSRNLLGGERQVVRTGFDRERHAVGARRRDRAGSASADARWTMWTCAPNSRASAIKSSMAACSARGGRLCQPGRVAARIAASRGSREKRGQLRVHEQRHASRARIGIASRRSASVTCANSSTPDGAEEALEAAHARARERLERHRHCPGTTPPQKPTSTWQRPAAARRFASSAATRRRGRNAVERHVDERGHAARRGRARRRLEAFPVGAAGLVDVDVRIDKARQHDQRRRHRPCARPARNVSMRARRRRCGRRGRGSSPAGRRPATRRARCG